MVDALDILQQQDFVDETSIFGNNIHININAKYKNEETIKYILTEQNSIPVHKINKIVPTLEDVFIHLLEKNKTK